MLVVHVDIQVKAADVKAFIEASVENARKSLCEPGIARFDIVQDRQDSAHFVLVEVYRTPESPAAHKETAHYAAWRDTVAPMMARLRESTKFDTLYPEDNGWD